MYFVINKPTEVPNKIASILDGWGDFIVKKEDNKKTKVKIDGD